MARFYTAEIKTKEDTLNASGDGAAMCFGFFFVVSEQDMRVEKIVLWATAESIPFDVVYHHDRRDGDYVQCLPYKLV